MWWSAVLAGVIACSVSLADGSPQAIFVQDDGMVVGADAVPAVGEKLATSQNMLGGTAIRSSGPREEASVVRKADKVSTCRDKSTQCTRWRSKLTCDAFPMYMLTSCAKTCGVCFDSSEAVSRRMRSSMNLCADFVPKSACRQMQASGGCRKAWLPMSLACRASCHTGPCHDYSSGRQQDAAPLCVDQSPKCFIWKILGQCKANPAYMLRGCPKSCGVCGASNVEIEKKMAKHAAACADMSPYCEDWMQQGHCSKRYVSTTCRKSCGVAPCKVATHIYMKTAATTQHNIDKLRKALPSESDTLLQLAEEKSTSKKAAASTVWLKKSSTTKSAHPKKSVSKKIQGDITKLKKTGLWLKPKEKAQASCKDEHPHCSHWAVTGQCRAHPAYMLRSCKKSCERCNASDEELRLETQTLLATCADYHTDCAAWAERGDCRKYWLYMSLTCRATCKVGPCQAKTTAPIGGKKAPAKTEPKLSCKESTHGGNKGVRKFLKWACGLKGGK